MAFRADRRADRPAGLQPAGVTRIVRTGFAARVHEVVRRIPAGRVATYGDVAATLGDRRVARHVGFALAALPPGAEDVPWHRVVSARGVVSPRADGRPSDEQIRRLAAEGIAADLATGRIAGFARFRHAPRPP